MRGVGVCALSGPVSAGVENVLDWRVCLPDESLTAGIVARRAAGDARSLPRLSRAAPFVAAAMALHGFPHFGAVVLGLPGVGMFRTQVPQGRKARHGDATGRVARREAASPNRDWGIPGFALASVPGFPVFLGPPGGGAAPSPAAFFPPFRGADGHGFVRQRKRNRIAPARGQIWD